MAQEHEQKAIATYLAIMEEVKDRSRVLNAIYQNEALFPNTIVREICYLQFRCLCELVALACLVAHGDVSNTKKIRDTWEANKIIAEMSKLKPLFYPQPCESRSGGIVGLPHINHLTKDDLIKLWGISGDVLHRTPLSQYVDPSPTRRPKDFSDVVAWGEKIAALLDVHWITLTETRGMLVSLTEGKGGKARASTFDFSLTEGKVHIVNYQM